jgi:hypothetical protein
MEGKGRVISGDYHTGGPNTPKRAVVSSTLISHTYIMYLILSIVGDLDTSHDGHFSQEAQEFLAGCCDSLRGGFAICEFMHELILFH